MGFVSGVTSFPRKTVELVLEFLYRLPSTNSRIFVTLIAYMGTAVKYWASSGWEPSAAWLGFLTVMAGLDWGQFHSKRKTYLQNGETNE